MEIKQINSINDFSNYQQAEKSQKFSQPNFKGEKELEVVQEAMFSYIGKAGAEKFLRKGINGVYHTVINALIKFAKREGINLNLSFPSGGNNIMFLKDSKEIGNFTVNTPDKFVSYKDCELKKELIYKVIPDGIMFEKKKINNLFD